MRRACGAAATPSGRAQEAASSFCNEELAVDMPERTVTASKIFKWYADDFAPDPKERLRVIAWYCDGPLAADLKALAEGGGKVTFKYKPYDWSSNAQ